jgi:hypothetical protein
MSGAGVFIAGVVLWPFAYAIVHNGLLSFLIACAFAALIGGLTLWSD